MDWMEILTAVGSSTVISGIISKALDVRARRDQAREERHTANIKAARDALSLLRTAYQTAYQQLQSGTEVGEHHLIELENEFDAAMGGADSPEIFEAARQYQEVGRGYASGDPDTGLAAEQSSYYILVERINERSQLFRPAALVPRLTASLRSRFGRDR